MLNPCPFPPIANHEANPTLHSLTPSITANVRQTGVKPFASHFDFYTSFYSRFHSLHESAFNSSLTGFSAIWQSHHANSRQTRGKPIAMVGREPHKNMYVCRPRYGVLRNASSSLSCSDCGIFPKHRIFYTSVIKYWSPELTYLTFSYTRSSRIHITHIISVCAYQSCSQYYTP